MNRDLHNGWRMTTDHAASSYNQPVLVGPDGTAYGKLDLLTTAQAAEALGMTARRVRALCTSGRLEAHKPGSEYLIPAVMVMNHRPKPQGRPWPSDRFTAVCPSCGTTYDGRRRDGEVQGYNGLQDEWISGCAMCGAPNLEEQEE